MSLPWLLITLGVTIGSFFAVALFMQWWLKQRQIEKARRQQAIAKAQRELADASELYRSGVELSLPADITQILFSHFQHHHDELAKLAWGSAQSNLISAKPVLLDQAPLQNLPVYLKNMKTIAALLWRDVVARKLSPQIYRGYQRHLRRASTAVRLECYFRQCMHAETNGYLEYAEAQAKKAMELAERDDVVLEQMRFERFLPIEDVERLAAQSNQADQPELVELTELINEPAIPDVLVDAIRESESEAENELENKSLHEVLEQPTA